MSRAGKCEFGKCRTGATHVGWWPGIPTSPSGGDTTGRYCDEHFALLSDLGCIKEMTNA